MTTTQAAMLLWFEATATAIAYATLGASTADAPTATRARLLGAVLVAHALVVTAAWSLAGGPGDARALAITRVLLGAEALATWGLAAALRRARFDASLAAASAALVMIALVVAPAPGVALARTSPRDDGAAIRSYAHAASPPYAASVELGLDVLHEPALYGRFPTATMEMHMVPWIWTAGTFTAAGLLLALVTLRRRRGGSLATAALAAIALLAVPACKKDEPKEGPKDTPKEAPKDPAKDPAKDPNATKTPDAPKGPTADEIKASIARGVEFLAKSKGEGEQIGGHPGLTALSILAMVSAEGVKADDPRVAPSLAMLAKLAKPDGAIFDKDYPVYVTALATLAFQAAGVEPELVKKAQRWLADKQFAEGNKVDAANVNYGGVGYGVDQTHPDADLSNLHFALDAIKDAEITDRAEVLARAQKFVERCQNRTESNDQPWSGNDGGFVYKPGKSKAGDTNSSGSMTYAGIASFVYTQADAKDARVAAALDYIKRNYSVDENPGLGLKGLFYHHHMMARALGLLGERTLVDADGQSHDWVAELTGKLVSMQKPDGSWVNTDETYWESNPVMATARAVLALEHALAAMK